MGSSDTVPLEPLVPKKLGRRERWALGLLALLVAILPAYFAAWSLINGPAQAPVFLGWGTAVILILGWGILSEDRNQSLVNAALLLGGCEMLSLAGYIFVTSATMADAEARRQSAEAVLVLVLGGLVVTLGAAGRLRKGLGKRQAARKD